MKNKNSNIKKINKNGSEVPIKSNKSLKTKKIIRGKFFNKTDYYNELYHNKTSFFSH